MSIAIDFTLNAKLNLCSIQISISFRLGYFLFFIHYYITQKTPINKTKKNSFLFFVAYLLRCSVHELKFNSINFDRKKIELKMIQWQP